MTEKKLYTCDICKTDYASKEKAIQCEKNLTSIQDIDPIEFLEDYFGIKLFMYQKEILRKMWSTGKIYIYPWQSYERPNIRVIYEMAKCFSLINDDVDITEVKKHVTNGTD